MVSDFSFCIVVFLKHSSTLNGLGYEGTGKEEINHVPGQPCNNSNPQGLAIITQIGV